MGIIKIGEPIATDKIPAAFYLWLHSISDKYDFFTLEVRGGEVQVVRVKTPINSVEEVENLTYGKITSDSSGVFLERTFMPRYNRAQDEIVIEQ